MVGLIQGKYEKAKAYYEENITKDYFEFNFSYVPSTETFREIDRFLWESRHQMTRFRNQYKGPVLIDITSWNEHKTNIYFDAFMFLLKDRDYYECTFIVQNECSKELLDKLQELFETKIISLDIDKKYKKTPIGFAVSERENKNVRI